LRALRGGLGFARHLDPERFGQGLDGLREAQVVVAHQKAERRAVRAAAEAVVEAFARADREGGRLLAVERAESLVVRARALQRYACADHLDHVRPGEQLVDERLRY